jgi:AcrR family transcriptional regulator
MARPAVTLSRHDWINAGMGLLVDGGIASVKLAAVAHRLGVTSGSFYHHFGGWRDYLDALADHHAGWNVDRIVEALEPIADPAQRIRALRILAEEWNVARLDSAMRVWATSDPRARAAVARLDDRLLEIVRAAFAELGFSHEQARVRALMALAAGAGEPFLFGRPSHAQDATLALEILLRAE